MPLVSVIIPTYNLAHYIVETVESVLMQSYDNIEVIIDDGSQDNTEEVLAALFAIKLAIRKTNLQNVMRWGNLGKSLVGFIGRKLTRQV